MGAGAREGGHMDVDEDEAGAVEISVEAGVEAAIQIRDKGQSKLC